jgi:hypothetical protein
MASASSKGNYYKKKTKDWFESRGYTVQLTEFTTARPLPGGKMLYTKKDVFGSDGISMNGDEIIFWNSKATTLDRKDGISKMKSDCKKDFEKYPFPKTVKLQAVIWTPRQPPIVIEL